MALQTSYQKSEGTLKQSVFLSAFAFAVPRKSEIPINMFELGLNISRIIFNLYGSALLFELVQL